MSALEDYLDRILGDRIGVSINDTARILNRSKRRVYVLLDEGELESYTDGASRLILAHSIRSHVLRRVAAGDEPVRTSPRQTNSAPKAAPPAPRHGPGRPPKRKLAPPKTDREAQALESAHHCDDQECSS